MKCSFFLAGGGVEDETTPSVEVEQLTDSKTLNPCTQSKSGDTTGTVESCCGVLSLSALGRSTLNGQQGDNADIMRYAATQPNMPGSGLNDDGDDNWRFAIDNG